MSNDFTPEVKKMLEKLIGKPYEQITLADIEKISPGINNNLLIHNAKTMVNTLKKW